MDEQATTVANGRETRGADTAGVRNLVVSCDGTGNIWGNKHDTNVVKLVRWAERSQRQLVYYDPGVGTADSFPTVGSLDTWIFHAKLLFGLAFGRGIYENIAQAYEFLVDNYRAGDRIFLFGFSRGAFTARAVSGLISMFGIVRPAATPMLPVLLRIYFSERGEHRDRCALDIRRHFTDTVGTDAEVHFIGVWDTVASVGGLFGRRHITSDRSLTGKPFKHVCHAVSEGEYRAAYRPRLYTPARAPTRRGPGPEYTPSLKQVWFAGVHSDVGGSYAESGLSDIALAWMLDEASTAGLRRDAQAEPPRPNPRARAHDQALASPFWALTGLIRRRPPQLVNCHPSLRQRLESASQVPEPDMASARRWLYASGAATVALLALLWVLTAAIRPPETSALKLAVLQLTSAVADPTRFARYQPGLARVLWLDVLLMAAYTCLFCVLAVFATRGIRHVKPESRAFHVRFRRLFQYGLLILPASDLLENVLTAAAAAGGYGVPRDFLSLASATKLLALLALFSGLSWAALQSWLTRGSRHTVDARASGV